MAQQCVSIPSQTSNKIDIADVLSPFETDGPAAGKGESDGPGTYKRMITNSYGESGAFIQPKGKGKRKGKEREEEEREGKER